MSFQNNREPLVANRSEIKSGMALKISRKHWGSGSNIFLPYPIDGHIPTVGFPASDWKVEQGSLCPWSRSSCSMGSRGITVNSLGKMCWKNGQWINMTNFWMIYSTYEKTCGFPRQILSNLQKGYVVTLYEEVWNRCYAMRNSFN